MSIEIMRGDADIFASKATALVNPVDCTGAQGKGLALEFKRRFPVAASCFKYECDAGEVRIGRVFLVGVKKPDADRTIVFFPTKRHWRMNSSAIDVAAGLMDMERRLAEIEVKSVAIPALGCGLGGLPWSDVLPLIRTFSERPVASKMRIEVYPPRGQ